MSEQDPVLYDVMKNNVARLTINRAEARNALGPDVLAGRTPSLLSGAALEHSIHAALRPSGKRVRANFKRLSGRKA